ncbi:unnamed protein product [Lactuca virosa]|uniref:DUF674 domain-containing protein n=1 Tax=Lactuca virosa TaxID=75947 RepID=A0AAU9N2K6_9ASTR|nr:unnamed protein product [Lactuca virosa]
MASENMTLKLLVNKATQKVLYAEATKEFVDFLFHLFSLPVGTLIQLVGSKQMTGCLGKLKESLESFNQIYFQPGVNKDNMFNSSTTFNGNMFLLDDVSAKDKPATSTTKHYSCSFLYKPSKTNTCGYYTENPSTLCPSCLRGMSYPLTLIETPVLKEPDVKLKRGFVKEVVTYMVMDDLVVKPLSTFSSIAFINSCGVNDMTQLEERTLHIGEEEALKLLKASLSTNSVLTSLLQKIKVEGSDESRKRSREVGGGGAVEHV